MMDETKEKVFVMESPRIGIKTPVLLTFDLFQRSVGPQLKVQYKDNWGLSL
jgi:hypothetical protein